MGWAVAGRDRGGKGTVATGTAGGGHEDNRVPARITKMWGGITRQWRAADGTGCRKEPSGGVPEETRKGLPADGRHGGLRSHGVTNDHGALAGLSRLSLGSRYVIRVRITCDWDGECGIWSDAVVTLRQLSKTYSRGGNRVAALHEVDLRIQQGEFCAFVGPSGCGKSTLLNLIAGLDSPSSGDLMLDGQDTGRFTNHEWTRVRREVIGIVFQAFHLVHGLTAEENIALPLMLRGEPTSAIVKRVDEMLEMVGMSHRRHHRPAEMSGGEQQRIALARALAHRPRLLLADEPTGNIDSHQGAEIMTLIRTLATAGGQTVLLVTHSDQAALAADYVWRMQDGRLVSRTVRPADVVGA